MNQCRCKNYEPEKPPLPASVHVHDCPDCSFCGTISVTDGGRDEAYDIYICPKSHSFIMRYGNDDKYLSYPLWKVTKILLGEPCLTFGPTTPPQNPWRKGDRVWNNGRPGTVVETRGYGWTAVHYDDTPEGQFTAHYRPNCLERIPEPKKAQLGPHPFVPGYWVGRPGLCPNHELNLDKVCDTRTTDRHEWQECDGSWHPCDGFVAYSVEQVTG